MKATGWKGGTYGIRVGKENAMKYFDKTWSSIEVEIDGEFFSFNLSEKFWTTYPEFRGAVIGKWFNKNGLAPWPYGKTPQVELVPLEQNRFRLLK